VDGQRVLSEAAVKKMLEPQYTADRHLPATTYGMTFWSTHGQQLLHKDGMLGDQIGAVVLAPASRLRRGDSQTRDADAARARRSLVRHLLPLQTSRSSHGLQLQSRDLARRCRCRRRR
jgi:hypothetical protein